MHMKKVIPMLFIAASLNAQAATRPDTTDPYRWLEELNGERAMSWVKAENAKTTAVLEADPRYADIYKEAFRMAAAKDRIPYPTFIGGELYNFWQDSAHKRGIWRKTSLASYRSNPPAWVTVLDLWPQMLSPGGSTIPPELMPDAVHPSAQAYEIWSKELERVMR